MRKIVFRGKSIKLNPYSLWDYGSISEIDGHSFLVHMEECSLYDGKVTYVPVSIEIIPETVCEYTGIYDSNAHSIWEGDIIEVKNPKPFKSNFGYVVFENGIFKVKFDGFEYTLEEMNDESFEFKFYIVGNIFDNKELLASVH